MIKKLKIRTFILAFLTMIICSLTMSFSLINSDNYLRNFKILNVTNISTKYNIEFEPVEAAKEYEIIIYDENSARIYNKTVNTTNVTLDIDTLSYDKKYKLMIYAYDNLGNTSTSRNPYEFIYVEPTFDPNNDLVVNNENKTIKINGNLNSYNYTLALYQNEELIYKDNLESNSYTITNNYFNNEGEYKLKIFKEDNIIDEISLFYNTSPLSDIKITSPNNNDLLDYGDITVLFDGGNNATGYILEIYKDDILIKNTNINDNKFVISSEFFQKDNKYTIKITGYYLDYTEYTKSDTISFNVNEKETLKPAYINVNPNYVTKGSIIILNNPNNSGTIYYTLDGSEPNENSLIYADGIIANNNMTIKCLIKDKYKNDSVTSTFDINIGTKTNYKVYLSPSNQDGNYGVKSVGFTNEMKEMNDLSNYIESKLKEYGIKVYRNNPNGNINLWVADSLYYGSDLHIAIHSNGSTDHLSKGIETWINEQTSSTYSLASIIQNDLINIYYDKENGNRGVKYSNGALGETRMPRFGILVEVAHHDDKDDAYWIMNNKKLIGETIANSILKYYGLIWGKKWKKLLIN